MRHPNAPALGIGIDTGGTFTYIVLFNLAANRILRKAKTPTTHGNYAICIGEAFRAVALAAGESQALRRVCLSTTLATNTVAEDKVHPSALLIEPGDISVPPGLHPRMALLRSEVGFNAMELRAVSEAEVVAAATPHAPHVESFAVSGYGSTRNPDHEREIGEILRRRFGKPVVLGSELTHQLNFMQRAKAAALNAGLLPVILEWLLAVKGILAGLEIACPLYIVKGDGSLMEEDEALLRPVQTLFSGPAASLRGGAFLSGESDAIVIDVGGTTTDIGRIRAGRGHLRRGGIRINNSQIAVDGLDIATFGLGGDSRFRISSTGISGTGNGGFRFESERVLPYCRAAERYPGLSLDPLEAELADQWHFGDPELLEMAGLEREYEHTDGLESLDAEQRAILAALRNGPRRVRALGRTLGLPHFAQTIDDLIRRRWITRIGLTPTDLFCAEGKAPAFSRDTAVRALALHARMLDRTPEAFQAELDEVVRRQAAAVLAAFLGDHGPPLAPGTALMARLTALMFNTPMMNEPGGGEPLLGFDPGCNVVLVGAGAPVLFENVPEAMAQRMVTHPDGDVANAVGAIMSQFLLRESVSIEPLKQGRVELYDHQGKREFPSLAEALEQARSLLRDTLEKRGRELGLNGTHFEIREDILEDYADYSRRARKELVIARIEATLSGMPE